MMKKYSAVVLLACMALSSAAGELLKPGIKSATTFAIIIDAETFRHARAEVLAYQKSVEADGLGTYVIARDWANPDEIRSVLRELYADKRSPLEGAVFVGDIPVPMIREAQYLTSTFKMSETLRWDRSSVPSDRFYDDFDLEFEFLKQDEDPGRKNLFYYKIKAGSPQYIAMDIYTGRIKPPLTEGKDDRAAQIKKYLDKIVSIRSEKNPLNEMIVSTGHGYNSNSTSSWGGEMMALRTSFPGLFMPGNNIKFISYRSAVFMKKILLSELQRQELDFAFMTGHGTATQQLINGYPDVSSPQPSMENVGRYIRSKMRAAKESGRDLKEVREGFQKSLGLNDKWFDDAFTEETIAADSIFNENLDIQISDVRQINARVAYLNSCLTGSFHLNDYLAGHYPFSEGRNVLAFANSVGVLQDLYGIELAGILQHGVRAGFLLRKTAYLETHIFGDPTYHFDSGDSYNGLFAGRGKTAKQWEALLRTGDADLQAYALTGLSELKPGTDFSRQLLGLLKTSPYEAVRTQAYFLLRSYQDPFFAEALQAAACDNYEYLRRKAVYDLAEIGSDDLIPLAVKTYLENQEATRVIYKLEWAFQFLDQDKVLAEFDSRMKDDPAYSGSGELYERLQKKLRYEKEKTKRMEADLLDAGASDKSLIGQLRTLRAYRYHRLIGPAIALALDAKRPEPVRIAALEALSWFGMSYRKADIKKACEQVIGTSGPGELGTAARKTLNVLEDTGKRAF
ncbi:MAG: hypothetical protein ABS46_20105 [Cytophagaceae bacterium SCN 52-12]|nr:MAG: hypothetical protein ABS46_20105 [Cytophagaceae bacterium SCN 52-12]